MGFAVLATLACAAGMFLSYLILSQKVYPIPYEWKRIVPSTTLVAGCAGAGMWLSAPETLSFGSLEWKFGLWLAVSGYVVHMLKGHPGGLDGDKG